MSGISFMPFLSAEAMTAMFELLVRLGDLIRITDETAPEKGAILAILKESRDAIASIPAMVKRLKDNDIQIREQQRIQQRTIADNDRLRARIAELEALNDDKAKWMADALAKFGKDKALNAELVEALEAAVIRIPNEHDFDHTPADDDVRAQCRAALAKAKATAGETSPETEGS